MTDCHMHSKWTLMIIKIKAVIFQLSQIQYQQPKAQPKPKKPVYKLQEEEESPEDYDVSTCKHNLEFTA